MKQGWEIKKLGEVCDIVGGSTPKTGESSYWDGEHFWVTPAELDGAKYISSTSRTITDAGVKSTHLQLLPSGTVLLSSRAPIGKVAITTTPMYCNQGFKNLVCSNMLYNEFAYWFLYYNTEYLNSLGTGATFKEISKRVVEQIPIPVPPREEQERIVEELDCLSGVIEKKREQLRELDSLAQSIFYTMFGDPITNEKGWEVKKLEELCDIINGFAFPSSDFADCNPIKVIKITNVGVNEFISDDSSLPDDYNNMEGCKVHTGDIVIALTRTIISTGVKRAIVPNEYNESLVNQRVAAILANDRIVSRRFIYSFLGTDFVRQYILQKATALMQPNLSIRDLRDMPTIYPPLALQHEFADKIEAIERQKELIKQSITETETLFNARMDYYFN